MHTTTTSDQQVVHQLGYALRQLAEDRPYAIDRREAVTGLPARPGTIR